MKKSFKYIFLLTALLVGFTGCVKEEFEIENRNTEDIPYPTEGKATIQFTVALPGNAFAGTKATMADKPTIENMRIAVFGSSGFLKESVQIDEFEAATTNGDATLYNFKAQLSVTDSKKLRVHIIANIGDVKLPWKYDSEVLTKYVYSTNNQDAYWAGFILPNGITLKKKWDNEKNEMVYVQDGDGYYQVTDDVTDAFCGGPKPSEAEPHPGLPLVRNFAKISIQSVTPQFVLDKEKTLAVINKPDRGSIVPYNPDNGSFLYGYKDSLYVETSKPGWGLKYSYPGFSPSGTQLVDTDPDGTSVIWGEGTGDGEEIVSSVYMYERPKASAEMPASYMIVHGTFYPFNEQYFTDNQPKDWKDKERNTPGKYLDLAHGVPCYYKVDFSDDEGPYAIFRNFRYHIRITNVAKAGAETAGAAGSTGGTGDITQNADIASLTDISDGYGRIAVSHTGWTFVEGRAWFELKYKFIQDATEGDMSANNALVSEGGPVTITIGTKSGPVNVLSTTLDASIVAMEGTVVDGGENGLMKALGASTAKDAEGFRTLRFTINTPDDATQTTQTIHIVGQIDATHTISRDVVYYLMPRQNMIVECVADVRNPDYGEDYVEAVAGEGINVNITIPKMLPESMFPLVFQLESDQLSITPNTSKYPEDNLPVENGYSICEGKSSSKTFHYVRTLSYTEYQDLTETMKGMQFTCHFKTNKAASAGKIYVDNQYFNKGNDSFYNYSMYSFRNMSFDNNSAAAYTNVNFAFYLDNNDSSRPRTVQVKLDGLIPQSTAGDWAVEDVDEGIYTYAISSGNTATLALKTITNANGFDGTYAVTLNAFEGGKAIYHEASCGNKAQRITVDPTSHTMHAGETKTIKATIWPAEAGTGTITWNSDNTSVATVDGNGKVTAVSVGTARITAAHSGQSATCVITVAPIEVRHITLDRNTLNLGLNKTRTLVATIMPTNATDKTVTWSTSDESVATVSSNGLVRGIAYGTATITATSSNGLTATCTVHVVPTPVEGVSLNKTSTTLIINGSTYGTEQLIATITPADAVNKNVTWTSSNPAVATVSDTGLVTAVAKGTATITVTTVDGGYTASCTVRVGVRKTVTTSAINTNSGTFNINYYGEGSLTAQGLKIDVGNADNSTANYLEMGLRYNRNNYNGTLSISSSETLDDFSITGVNFTYTEYNYAQGAVTPSTGTYTGPANNATTASWSGNATSTLTFTMQSRTQGNTRYWNRLRSIVVTYTYTEY